ncbi:MAG: MOSC domain-containing protein [Porticoccaceae bacterium]
MNELNDIPSPPAADLFYLQAELRQIIISPGHDYWGRQGEGRMQAGVKLCDEIECVAGKGLVGDRYFGFRPDFKGQVTFFDYSVYEEIKRTFNLPKLPPSVFRRNLVIAGMNLKFLIGKKFSFQGIQFEGCQECTPCAWMDRTVAEGVQAFMKVNVRGGLRAKILTSGILRRDT